MKEEVPQRTEREEIDQEDREMVATLVAMLERAKTGPKCTPEKQAFLDTLPTLNTRRNARIYITRVAVGFRQGHLTSQEVRTHLYAAQLALGAAPTPPPRVRKAKP